MDAPGFEPGTFCLQADALTTELYARPAGFTIPARDVLAWVIMLHGPCCSKDLDDDFEFSRDRRIY